MTDDLGPLGITGIDVSGSTITLTVARALDTGARITYGRSVNPFDTWIVDTAGVPVPCFQDVSIE